MFDQQTVPYDHVDTGYQTFKMQDFERRADAPLLVQIEYLRSMFDLTVENDRDKKIVITLTEKEPRLVGRRNGLSCLDCGKSAILCKCEFFA